MSQTDTSKQVEEGEEEVLPPRKRLLVALAIIPAGAMQGTDTFAVAVALPTMMGAMSATITEISWVLTSYLVAGAIFTPLYAWMSRKIGRRRLFIIVVVGFMACALMVSQSTSLTELIIFRFCQGFFGAGLNPLTYQVVLASFPKTHQGPAFGWLQTGRMGPRRARRRNSAARPSEPARDPSVRTDTPSAVRSRKFSVGARCS